MARSVARQKSFTDEIPKFFPNFFALWIGVEKVADHEHLKVSNANHRQNYDGTEVSDTRAIQFGEITIASFETSQHVLQAKIAIKILHFNLGMQIVYLMLTSLCQVSPNNVNVVENVLHFHFVKLFRRKSIKGCNGSLTLRNWIVWILLQQLEEDRFPVEVADRVVETEFDFPSIVFLLVSAGSYRSVNVQLSARTNVKLTDECCQTFCSPQR